MRDIIHAGPGDPDPIVPARGDAATGWQASLALGFAHADGATRLVRREHRGPLRVQKALYPEGPRACHVILVHPPGGVAGGDRLRIEMALEAGTHVLATTPGAAKWYRVNGRPASQAVRLRVAAGAALEWLPQETIFYDDADVVLEHELDLAEDASYIGMEILCFGRRASGERFARGRVAQRTRIRRAGRTIWWEQGRIEAGAALDSPLGLGGHAVCATLLAVGKPAPGPMLAALRAADPGLALSQVKNVFVARHLGMQAEDARASLLRVWQALRPHLLGIAAQPPRIWTT